MISISPPSYIQPFLVSSVSVLNIWPSPIFLMLIGVDYVICCSVHLSVIWHKLKSCQTLFLSLFHTSKPLHLFFSHVFDHDHSFTFKLSSSISETSEIGGRWVSQGVYILELLCSNKPHFLSSFTIRWDLMPHFYYPFLSYIFHLDLSIFFHLRKVTDPFLKHLEFLEVSFVRHSFYLRDICQWSITLM